MMSSFVSGAYPSCSAPFRAKAVPQSATTSTNRIMCSMLSPRGALREGPARVMPRYYCRVPGRASVALLLAAVAGSALQAGTVDANALLARVRSRVSDTMRNIPCYLCRQAIDRDTFLIRAGQACETAPEEGLESKAALAHLSS